MNESDSDSDVISSPSDVYSISADDECEDEGETTLGAFRSDTQHWTPEHLEVSLQYSHSNVFDILSLFLSRKIIFNSNQNRSKAKNVITNHNHPTS